jgi:NAD(P)-dependent dehydrogenase (short-subunit alcohol dehydrogenase family)
MDLRLKDTRALVTGSSSGIGEAIAAALAKEGVKVVVHGRDAERTRRAAAEIGRKGGQASVAIGDLATDEGASGVARQTLEALGGLDILVNNAGGSDGGPQGWADATREDWQTLFEQNFFSVVRLVQHLTPALRAGGWGRIINIATGLAIQPTTWLPHYAAAKAALVNATVSLSREFAGSGVTINTVSPGPIHTPAAERVLRGIARDRGWATEDWKEIERRVVKDVVPVPVGRIGRSEEVAHAVAFLASPLADYIHGANLRVDGGFVASIN